MTREDETLFGHVEFRQAENLAPGDCDVCPENDVRAARYCVGGRYFCAECLIDRVESMKLPPDVIAFRLPSSAEEFLKV